MKNVNITLNLKKDENLVKEDIKQMIIEHLLVDGNATSNEISVDVMSGGITNKLYKIETPEQSLLCRVNGIGTEELLDRERETKYMNLMAKHGQGPRVFFTFNNGFVYTYIPGRCLSTDEMEKYAPQIAKQMANFHKMNIDIGDKTESNIIRMAKKWFRDVKKFTYDNNNDQEREVAKKVDALNVPLMEQELILLEQLATKYNCDLVFCHNDLLPYNIIKTEMENGECAVHFIDYEYCGYNYRSFDIGNHFCEHSAKIDPNLYPSVQVQTRFIKYYLENADMGPVTDELIEQLRVEANFFALVVNLAWGTWAVPQAKYSNIKFDYMQYGSEKYAWYWAKRDLYIRELTEFYESRRVSNSNSSSSTLQEQQQQQQ